MRRDLERMARRKYDLAVVGGGITGAAIARDAALRGMSVALFEAHDFSHATSAATSKLVHGGLRYLKTFDFGLVRESLAERRIWQRIAPHMVYAMPFLLPVREGVPAALAFHAGLTLYDLLAPRKGRGPSEPQLPAHRWISQREALARAPILEASKPACAMLYYDCQMFAPERLALECLHDAAAHGAELANYADVVALERAPAAAALGVIVEDNRTGLRHTVAAELVVNATGPWADLALARWQVDRGRLRLIRSKGVHILTRALSEDHALMLPVDGVHLFVLPWRGHSLIGVTDTAFEGAPEEAHPTREELDLLLDRVNRALPGTGLSAADIRYAFAGVRPLVASASQVSTYKTSRRAEIVDHGEAGGPARLISVIGGKWTTARRLAEQTVDRACRILGRPGLTAHTAETPLPGGRSGRFLPFLTRLAGAYPELSAAQAAFLARSYGSLVEDVLAPARDDRTLLEPLAPEHPSIGAQVIHAVDEEMALRLEDVVLRRTGLGTLGFPGEAALARAALLMQRRLGWDAEETERQLASVRAHYAALPHANAALRA